MSSSLHILQHLATCHSLQPAGLWVELGCEDTAPSVLWWVVKVLLTSGGKRVKRTCTPPLPLSTPARAKWRDSLFHGQCTKHVHDAWAARNQWRHRSAAQCIDFLYKQILSSRCQSYFMCLAKFISHRRTSEWFQNSNFTHNSRRWVTCSTHNHLTATLLKIFQFIT